MSTVIVVGAGSAGMTLAWRLSATRPDVEIVLVEAGADPGEDVPVSLRREMLLPEQYYWPYVDADTGGFLPRGRVLGGSSAANAAAAVRGQPDNFDGWDVPGWAWDDCLPAFVGLENDQQFGAAEYHGSSGPIPITRYPQAGFDAFLAEQFRALGHEQIADHNAPGQLGFAPWPTNRIGEDRASTLLTLLPDLRTRSNVRIIADRLVTSLLFDGDVARGVVATDPQGGAADQIIEGDVVVLAAGAFGTPELFFDAGIGDPEQLRRFDKQVRSPLAGVGDNLSDHPFVQLTVPVNDSMRRPFDAGKGTLLTFELDDDGGHLGHLFGYRTAYFDPSADESLVSFTAALMSPASRGTLDLQPGRRAQVHLNHFAHPDDVRHGAVMLDEARAVVERAASHGLVSVPDNAWWAEQTAPSTLRAVAASYHHAAGTARMGTDDAAVVGPDLTVRGVEGLYVADASVMPTLPQATPNLAVMMIGWRAADLIALDRPRPTEQEPR